MKVRNATHAIMAFLLTFLIIPANTFASNDSNIDRTKESKIIFEVLPKLHGGTPQAVGGMDMDIFANYQPESFAAAGFLSYNAIDKIILSDLTGKWEGWKLTVEATPLKNDSYQFPKGTLSLEEPSNIVGLSGQLELPQVNYNDKIIIDDGQVLIASADKDAGMANFEIMFDEGSLSLAIDENSSYDQKPESGIYHTTLNWSLVSSDGEIKVLKSDDYSLEVDTDYLYENVKKPVKNVSEHNSNDGLNNVSSNISDDNSNVNFNGNGNNDNSNESTRFFGERLPSTATNIFNFMLIGFILIAAGTSVYIIRKKKSSK